ncbi:MAG: hypothetical protein M1837_000527 [Sclerophora amabilis]|nr:MAG: hypothetical protein M1837_000527 [Sclerophora amabilis]
MRFVPSSPDNYRSRLLYPVGAVLVAVLGYYYGSFLKEISFTTKAGTDTETMAMSGKGPSKSLNVLNKPLGLFSKSPMTGFYRNGYCDVGPEDLGNHSVAAQVTDEFLEFSASRGNDLRTVGLTGGCKWCLCASRWKEAMAARKNDDDPVVPKVFLHATHQRALDSLKMDDLKKFAAEGEASNAEQRPVEPSARPGAAVKEV